MEALKFGERKAERGRGVGYGRLSRSSSSEILEVRWESESSERESGVLSWTD